MANGQLKVRTYGCRGGVDMASPAVTIPPGRALLLYNYEVTRAGYRRINGYERFDGLPSPSEAAYWVLGFDGGTTEILADDVVVDGVTSATARVYETIVTSGSWATNDAAGELVLFEVSGVFADDSPLEVSAVQRATANGTAEKWAAPNDAAHNTYRQAAIEARRANIGAVPGSGPVRGVWAYADNVYAFRDNVGATACVMHKATAVGWAAVGLGETLAFTAGTAEIFAGDTITGGTSGATATVGSVDVQSGSWGGSDAAGKLTLISVTGTFQAETITASPSSGSATIAGDSVPQTLQPGGTYEFLNTNFYGSAGSEKMYGCDGVNPAFEFDGTTFTKIDTGLATDTPEHIAEHRTRLVLTYQSSVMVSVVGQPYKWDGVDGAAEFAVGYQVTDVTPMQGGVLGIWTTDDIQLLYGTDLDTFEIKPHTKDVGSYSKTVQSVGDFFFLTPRGVTTMAATSAFGDFEHATISQLVDPFLDVMRDRVITASRSREKNQYRVFFESLNETADQTTALLCRLEGRELLGFSMAEYPFRMHCIENVDVSSVERIFIGATNGFVYELDAGNSFDGASIEAFMRMPFQHFDSPTMRKRWMRCEVFLDVPESVNLQFQQEIDWGDYSVAAADATIQDILIYGGGGVWDLNNWNEFYWSTALTGRLRAKLSGRGTSMGLVLYSDMTYQQPYTVEGVAIHYLDGRAER